MSKTEPENIDHDNIVDDDIALDEAFNKLSGRISILTKAFDGFADRQDELVGRDYSKDLAAIENGLGEVSEEIANLAVQPVLALTPDRVAEQIEIAGRRVRSSDHDQWHRAQNRLDELARSMEGRLGSARTRNEQDKWIAVVAGIAAILAFFAGCTVPPAVSRSVPESWHWPEKRAANLLSRDMWGAGMRLMQTAHPDRWNELARASRLYHENAKAIAACEAKAPRRKKPVTCRIEIPPPVAG
ncbi:DUF6118 family protein [Sphingopyxis sp. NJF-3]